MGWYGCLDHTVQTLLRYFGNQLQLNAECVQPCFLRWPPGLSHCPTHSPARSPPGLPPASTCFLLSRARTVRASPLLRDAARVLTFTEMCDGAGQVRPPWREAAVPVTDSQPCGAAAGLPRGRHQPGGISVCQPGHSTPLLQGPRGYWSGRQMGAASSHPPIPALELREGWRGLRRAKPLSWLSYDLLCDPAGNAFPSRGLRAHPHKAEANVGRFSRCGSSGTRLRGHPCLPLPSPGLGRAHSHFQHHQMRKGQSAGPSVSLPVCWAPSYTPAKLHPSNLSSACG